MATTGTTGVKGTSVEVVLDALRHHPDATTAELAELAGIGRSTASRTLANLETEGRVTRRRGKSEAGGRTAPDRWTLVLDTLADRAETEQQPVIEEPAAEPADTTVTASEDEDHGGQAAPPASATTDTATAEATTATTDATQLTSEDISNPRLRPGALRALVHAWLADQPEAPHVPHQQQRRPARQRHHRRDGGLTGHRPAEPAHALPGGDTAPPGSLASGSRGSGARQVYPAPHPR